MTVLAEYGQRENTRREHAALIRQHYQYREFAWPWTFRLTRLLYTRSWISNERPGLLFDLALFIIAIKMIFPSAGSITGLAAGEEPFIVPMAIPMIAGPSVIAALLLLSSQHPNNLTDLSIAVLIAWFATFIILMFYSFFHRILGERGLKAVERLMGLLLVMISTQMFLNGVKSYMGAVS
ncbi:MarC family protein [Vibrio vulnificus]|uniref:MarC family protein n=1 Tax=Vibrio vulnificus TaxID=672 RepID=UPI003C705E50